MTDQEINIAIAEACGWQKVGVLGGLVLGWPLGCPFDYPHREIPDYLNDLNAIHRAEEVFTLEESIRYMKHLGNIDDDSLLIAWTCVHATARQRAEAFLRTIGKWRDG